MIGNWPNATFACLPGSLDEVEYVRAEKKIIVKKKEGKS
jgi:hypothetical protein